MYQVEYARRAVERATTVLGVVFSEGVVLVASKLIQKLLVPETIEKISKVDEHIGIAACGILADARTLIDYARIKAQINRITFGERIETFALVKDLADRFQRFTQIGGIRPYGVGFIIGGVDASPRVFEIDPSGTIREWRGHAIGRGAKEARKILTEEFKEGMTEEKAIDLALRALLAAEKKLTSKSTELVVITKERYKIFTSTELRELLKKYG
jgi:proteasome alpha subunit